MTEDSIGRSGAPVDAGSLREMARRIRVELLRAVSHAQAGHVGGPLSAAEILATLYFHELRIRPSQPDWPERDRFVLLDPMRRNFKDREVDSANEIVEFDLQDVRDADVLLVNYGKPSIGTAMEVFYASHNLGKFVVAFSPFTFKDCSPWMVKHCTKILASLDDAVLYIRENFISKHID